MVISQEVPVFENIDQAHKAITYVYVASTMAIEDNIDKLLNEAERAKQRIISLKFLLLEAITTCIELRHDNDAVEVEKRTLDILSQRYKDGMEAKVKELKEVSTRTTTQIYSL